MIEKFRYDRPAHQETGLGELKSKFLSQAKDVLARVTGKRNLQVGETCSLTGGAYCIIGGERQKSEKSHNMQIDLAGIENDGTEVSFYISTEGPVFTNTGKHGVEVQTHNRRGQDNDGKHSVGRISIQPGKNALLYPQGGDTYTLSWETQGGKKVVLAFSGAYFSHNKNIQLTEIAFRSK